jgi:hydrogenase expression/formation protein HypE
MAKIEMAHGAGGKIMQRLLEEVIIPSFSLRKLGSIGLDEMDDGATLPVDGRGLIVTADAHTVQPLFFPGGNIGTLAACGTINDLAVMGASPLAMTNTIVVEEGFEIDILREIVESIDSIIEPLGIAMIAGDTKVMPKGALDGLVISTTGIGMLYLNSPIADAGVKAGDDIILTGTIGDHGTALLAHREGLKFETDLISDVAPLWEPIRGCLDCAGLRIHAMKDPTRGGLAVALNEFASKSRVEIEIDEALVPVNPAVQSLCDILGLSPFHIACEGRAIIAADSSATDGILDALARFRTTENARVIGKARKGDSRVLMKTGVGGRKVLQIPLGEPIPRVC